MREHPYRLQAAFFHRGTEGSGHYWVYIYDFRKQIWRKYNDGYVTEVQDTSEIFRAPTAAELHTWSGPPNPYFLVYVRDDVKEGLVESVCRDIVPLPEPPAPKSQFDAMNPNGAEDIQMSDHSAIIGPSQSKTSTFVPWDALSTEEQDVLTKTAVEAHGWDTSEANLQVQW